uniref:R3H domain-containing protein n=1 Tax=Astyanax mexicanus TaxID=7994 RepID=A0A3B1KAP1_ASTMX
LELVCLLFQYLWDELVKRVFYLINCLCFSFSSVLLFPPLPNRLRFLIHQAAEKHPNLSTFSVGEDWSRRVVVCHAHLRLMPKLDSSDTDSSLYEHPYGSDRRRQGRSGGRAGHRYNHSRGNRRPDKAIYVPRALRQKLSESSDGSNGPSRTSSSSCLSATEESSSNTTDLPAEPPSVGSDPAPPPGLVVLQRGVSPNFRRH